MTRDAVIPYDGYVNVLDTFFNPASLAIVGATDTPGSVGDSLSRNLSIFTGTVYYVNPHHTSIGSSPCYPDLASLPSVPEVAVIATPAATVPAILEQAGALGIGHAVIISAGFKELGAGGADLENRIRSISAEQHISVIGPNCLGVMNPARKLNTSFAGSLPDTGNIAFVSQSGALMTAILDYAKAWNLGFSKCVSIGNKTVVNETDLLEYLSGDDSSSVILFYVEDIEDAARFVAVARKITQGAHPKPIILLKAGRTDAGAHASASHTGAIGGVDRYYDALCRQSGVIRVDTISEFLNTGMVASENTPPKGTAMGIVTNAGGPGVLVTDEAVGCGLTMATLTSDTIQQLSAILPKTARVHNPVDILGDAKADRYQSAIEALSADASVQNLLVLLTPQSGTQVNETAAVLAQKRPAMPVVASFMGQGAVRDAVHMLRSKHIAVTEYPEDAARALGRFAAFYGRKKAVPGTDAFPAVAADRVRARNVIDSFAGDMAWLPEREAGVVLSAYGFPMVRAILTQSEEEAVAAVTTIGGTCAMKVSSPAITHKRDVGGVMLHVTPQSAADAYRTIMENLRMHAPGAPVTGVIVKEMAPLGLECIIGMVRQPHFGTMIMVGMGGSFVEITKDVAFGVAPIRPDDALDMIASLHGSAVMRGYRGSQALDIPALIDALGRLSLLALDFPQLTEIDINPIILYPQGKGARVVDVRMKIQKAQADSTA